MNVQHFRSSNDRSRACDHKARHRTARHAKLAMRLTGEAAGDLSLVFYRCDHCGFFHVGHPPKSVQRRLRYQRLVDLIERVNAVPA